MPEPLTESFCERCGTRYAFEAPAKPKSLSKLGVLSRGLKSYVLTDGSSFGDVLSQPGATKNAATSTFNWTVSTTRSGSA